MTDNYKDVRKEGRKLGRKVGITEKRKVIKPKDQFSNICQ